MHPALISTISYYLHSNSAIPVVEKLKLAARCGNPLLLAGSLRFQCRRETIFDIVNRSPQDYQNIVDGAHAAYVASKMLEHAARETDDEYKDTLIEQVKQETSKFKDRCSKLIDFSLPSEEPDDEAAKSSSGDPESSSQCCLVVSNVTTPGASSPREPGYYYVNRAYLSSWSPVFCSMFYGDFADRRRQRITLELGESGEQRYWRLFLTLIHPSYMCTLWRLMPMEYCYSSTGRGVNNLNREWIDEAFSIIFDDGGIDALMHVFRLAHKFQVLPLVDFCVMIIEAKSDMTLADKILLADTYHLPTLMAWCIGKLTTARSVKRMFSENEQLLDNLSCSSHKILLERMLELV